MTSKYALQKQINQISRAANGVPMEPDSVNKLLLSRIVMILFVLIWISLVIYLYVYWGTIPAAIGIALSILVEVFGPDIDMLKFIFGKSVNRKE